MTRTRSLSEESVKVIPKSRWNGLKFGGSKAGADPLLLQTFVPARDAGS